VLGIFVWLDANYSLDRRIDELCSVVMVALGIDRPSGSFVQPRATNRNRLDSQVIFL
jgi:hypothetical protein